MNPTTLRLGYQAAHKAWRSWSNHRGKNAAKVYDTLQEAAQTALDKGSDLMESASEAISGSDLADRSSAVQKQAARRLEQSRKHASDYRKKAEEAAKKSGKELREAARDKATKNKKSKKKCCLGCAFKGVGKFLVIASVLGALGYFVMTKLSSRNAEKEKPGVNPPYVPSTTGDSSSTPTTPEGDTVVYSTETPEGTEVERDEKFIDEVNAQLDALEKKSVSTNLEMFHRFLTKNPSPINVLTANRPPRLSKPKTRLNTARKTKNN